MKTELSISRTDLVRRVGLGGPDNPSVRDRLVEWAERRASSFDIGLADGQTPLQQIGINLPGPGLADWLERFDEGVATRLGLTD